MFVSLYWFDNLNTKMLSNLQMSTFSVGVLCSLRNPGNSLFSPISFMHTQACMFHIFFFFSGPKSQLQDVFLHHSEPEILPVLDSSRNLVWNELLLWDGAGLGNPWRWLKVEVGRTRATIGRLWQTLSSPGKSKTPSRDQACLESTHPLQGTRWKDLTKVHRNGRMSPFWWALSV